MELLNDEMRDKVIIITGGNKGIGKGCAKVFTRVYANAVICGRNEKDGEETENEINSLRYGKCLFFRCDVTKEEDVKALIDYTIEKFGKIERYGMDLGVDIEGSGLGLYISKEIVELHDGQILVESEGRNKGSSFIVRLNKR